MPEINAKRSVYVGIRIEQEDKDWLEKLANECRSNTGYRRIGAATEAARIIREARQNESKRRLQDKQARGSLKKG